MKAEFYFTVEPHGKTRQLKTKGNLKCPAQHVPYFILMLEQYIDYIKNDYMNKSIVADLNKPDRGDYV